MSERPETAEARSELRSKLRRISPWVQGIPRGAIPGMRVPARVYITQEMLADVGSDRSLRQLANTAMLPGVVGAVLAMPDVHEGYGFPIGGVVATELPHGVISPGGVGYDINCGVRTELSEVAFGAVSEKIALLAAEIMRAVPSGTGRGGRIRLDESEMDAVLERGARWCVERGLGSAEDLERLEEHGAMAGADPRQVSARARERGRDQLGTLGSGNHFLELQRVDEIFDAEAARAFGLFEDQVVVTVHCGSRGLGHQVCTDHVRGMLPKLASWGIELPDRELACAPANSPEGRAYLAAMSASANFAWANRQTIVHHVRIEWERIVGSRLRTLYDVCHNIAKVEEHEVDGRKTKVLVHRKGATRAFGPGRPEVPAAYRAFGQPVSIPGTMGTASYVLRGTEEAMRTTFGSACHGAGRRMSRGQARRSVRGEDLKRSLEHKGIVVRCFSSKGLAEEAPLAYKDVEAVVEVVERAGIATKVARLRPVAVIKGE